MSKFVQRITLVSMDGGSSKTIVKKKKKKKKKKKGVARLLGAAGKPGKGLNETLKSIKKMTRS